MNTMKQSLKEWMALEQQLYAHTLEQEKMNRELERAQFLSLQSKINPHFLFNTLNTISHTALLDDTVALINALAEFPRYTLEYKDNVWLKTEFKFVRQYLSLQQARFKDRLGYSLNLNPSLTVSPASGGKCRQTRLGTAARGRIRHRRGKTGKGKRIDHRGRQRRRHQRRFLGGCASS